jgi:anti-sigma B factor antagonist
MSLTFERRTAPDGACVAVAGEIDIESAPRMRAALEAAVAPGAVVVVNLGGVTFMDSSGLSVLISVHQGARAVGATLLLQDVPARVLALLKITGMDGLLAIASDSDGRSAT